jgi:protein-S-isoprenylcysteine O-methyltransferase Ste14
VEAMMRDLKSQFKIIVASILLVAQYVLAFFVYKLPGWRPLQWLGWLALLISITFGIAPIFIFKKWGGVEQGKSFVHTARLVDTSLYAIVRHPQYLAGILFNIAMMLLAQQWMVILFGLISAVLIFLDIQTADQEGITKFGDEYRQYMQRVPQLNFILGIIRLITGIRAIEN